MELFKFLFKKKKKVNEPKITTANNKVEEKTFKPSQNNKAIVQETKRPLECLEILKFMNKVNGLLKEERFIARSEYIGLKQECEKEINRIKVLKDTAMLEEYCLKKNLSLDDMNLALHTYDKLIELFAAHNRNFINKALIDNKEYLDNILKDVDPVINLDDNQRKVVLSDEDYCLVIAGAGAGKTTTVAARVKYLVEKCHIDPKEILVVSFTNKAVNELREKINDDLQIDCIISTFHAIGNAILRKDNNEKFNIASESKCYYAINDFLKEKVLTDEVLCKKLVMFFSTYFDAPKEFDNIEEFLKEPSKAIYSTLKGDIGDYNKKIIDAKSKRTITIQNEILRSHQEVVIANFLYLSGIDYEYEPIYKYNIKYANKPYTPDFIIKQGDKEVYLEHFGISEEGYNNLYSKEELERYKKSINDKVKLHRQHNTKLIYTFSSYKDHRSLENHLFELLIENGFIIKPRPDREVLERLITDESNRYIRRLTILLERFIGNFKTCGYDISKFKEFRDSTDNVRNQLFLDVCERAYAFYQDRLKSQNMIDFADMINYASKRLDEMKNENERLHFKYVIVDEYQDISRQRFDLVTAIHNVCDAKIMAVGDDWQSIYAFSGSDVRLFTSFEEKMGYAEMLKIEMTYRNSQDIIDIAGNFIQKNETQIKKTLKSPKHIDDPIIIYTYDNAKKDHRSNNKQGTNYQMALAVEKALTDIKEFDRERNKKSKVLIIGRFNYEINNLEKTGLFEVQTIRKANGVRSVRYPDMDITFMTAHSSKGLGFDNVIILNCKNETFGFPCKIQDDPVLKFVTNDDRSYAYAEERRLFYVALTRTKNRVYCIAPENTPSEFVLEIKEEYKNVVLRGEFKDKERIESVADKRCPICGFPLQYKYKNAYGLRLFICTNEPEICGFMTNDLSGGKMSIMKCDHCKDGYLIVKRSGDQSFLGCTEYKSDHTGCNNTISFDKYKEMNCLEGDNVIVEPIAKTTYQSTYVVSNKQNVYESAHGNKLKKESENTYKDKNLYEILKVTLSCIEHVSEQKYYGVSVYVSILKGKAAKKQYQVDFEKVKEFGSLRELTNNDIQKIISWLISKRVLLKTKGLYPVLHLTASSADFINNLKDKDIEELKKILETKLEEI